VPAVRVRISRKTGRASISGIDVCLFSQLLTEAALYLYGYLREIREGEVKDLSDRDLENHRLSSEKNLAWIKHIEKAVRKGWDRSWPENVWPREPRTTAERRERIMRIRASRLALERIMANFDAEVPAGRSDMAKGSTK